MGQQPGKPKPPGNRPIRPEPRQPQPIEEPPKPIPIPPVESPPPPIVADLASLFGTALLPCNRPSAPVTGSQLAGDVDNGSYEQALTRMRVRDDNHGAGSRPLARRPQRFDRDPLELMQAPHAGDIWSRFGSAGTRHIGRDASVTSNSIAFSARSMSTVVGSG
jgi:hypothetical protein